MLVIPEIARQDTATRSQTTRGGIEGIS